MRRRRAAEIDASYYLLNNMYQIRSEAAASRHSGTYGEQPKGSAVACCQVP